MREKFLISVISMGRPDGAKACLDAILKQQEDFYLVLTSNGCKETSELFNQYTGEKVRIFHEKENTFFQYPHNRSYQIAKERGCKYLVLVNDDLIIPEGGLKLLAEALDNDPKAAISGARDTCQSLRDDLAGYPGGPLHYIEGSLLCLKIAVLDQYRDELWEPGLEGIYGEDSALSLFIQEKGYKIKTVNLTPEHARSVTVNRDPETQRKCMAFQGKNHEVVKKRFSYWLKTGKFDQPIIVKRKMAIGDVILTEPVIRAIKKVRPLSPIYVETDHPLIFEGHPCVRKAAQKLPEAIPNPLIIDLNGAYEKRTNVHIIEAYADEARKVIPDLGEVPFISKLHLTGDDKRWTPLHRKQTVGDSKKVCVICPEHGNWTGKNWPHHKWEEIARRLVESGWHVVCIGQGGKPDEVKHCINATGMFSIKTLGAYLQTCQLFIGHDSAPLHVALSVGTPSIGLFGVTNKRYILTDGAPRIGVESDQSLEGSGKRHRVANQTHVEVGPEVMDSITVDQVWRAVEVLSYQKLMG
jgi:ADP-heptose:LPS heptosyltransferase